MLVAKDFRFGMSMRFIKSRAAFVDKVKQAEDIGFDVLCVPDHLGAVAPIPALTAAAMVTDKLKLSMYVLNAAFYKPALLSRDLGDLDKLSDGRLEIGLGTGYVKEEFDAAELPYPSAGARVDYLNHMTNYLKEHHPTTPILIAGNGDRVLTIAAQHADIIGLTGSRVKEADDPLTERVEFVRNAAGDRFDALELNLAITAVPTEGQSLPDLTMTRRYAPGLSDEEILAMHSVLTGSPREMADTLSEYREKYGVTFITVQDNHIGNFAKVIAELR
ncbi:LLM class F420-dependent oxidoreductase [Mycobacterium nebraskense]|uniref:LLM class F420-dependent oxidoreductase n=1 Tax=Mycobacterium nebraskense TaxID=244292 RepID=UPI0009E27B09|nr:LLM class F420-dependent oxidoreductase [Mycobacterium nebraskense]MBI2693305.1 LLM class F420-dependent oxidoreductase [Mycobacterium nebraskense]MCV7119570.1 LLM class F420-dependent oxidoreductase [Mycobacterium nebraskense]